MDGQLPFEASDRREPKRLIRNILLNAEVMDEEQAELKEQAFRANRRAARRVMSQLTEAGFIKTEAEAEHWVSRIVAFGPDDKPSARSRTFMGLILNGSTGIKEFLRSRVDRFGGDSAITVEVRGRTGTGKSGMALAIYEFLDGKTSDVSMAVHFNPRSFVNASHMQVEARGRREHFIPAVIMDESGLSVGEGSGTVQETLRNREGRLREGGISQIYVRPNVLDMMERDLTIDMIGVSEAFRSYIGIAYVYGEPYGLVGFPFPEVGIWAAYQPLKKAALTSKGDPEQENLRREALEVLADEDKMLRIKEWGKSEVGAEFEINDGLVAGLSVNGMRKLVRIVMDCVRLLDDEEAYAKRALLVVGKTIPFGLTPAAEKGVSAWMTSQ